MLTSAGDAPKAASIGSLIPAEVFNGDSTQSTEQPIARMWSPGTTMVSYIAPTGPSLNVDPILSN